jgi:hypothetical protein
MVLWPYIDPLIIFKVLWLYDLYYFAVPYCLIAELYKKTGTSEQITVKSLLECFLKQSVYHNQFRIGQTHCSESIGFLFYISTFFLDFNFLEPAHLKAAQKAHF